MIVSRIEQGHRRSKSAKVDRLDPHLDKLMIVNGAGVEQVARKGLNVQCDRLLRLDEGAAHLRKHALPSTRSLQLFKVIFGGWRGRLRVKEVCDAV